MIMISLFKGAVVAVTHTHTHTHARTQLSIIRVSAEMLMG